MSDKHLRSKVIRLAHAKPELRPHLLPLLERTTANPPRLRSGASWWPEDSPELVEDDFFTPHESSYPGSAFTIEGSGGQGWEIEKALDRLIKREGLEAEWLDWGIEIRPIGAAERVGVADYEIRDFDNWRRRHRKLVQKVERVLEDFPK
jgi:hypothetical protein